MNEYKTYEHNPPHLFISNAKYFITSSTLGKYPYFKTDDAKWPLLDYLTKSLTHFNWELEDWVILDNHIHIMVNAPGNAKSLVDTMKIFHRFTANWLNRNKVERLDEKSYIGRLNYLWYNPVKHGYVDSPEKGKFGSYYYRFIEDEIKMKNLLIKYPFDKIKIYDDF